MASRRSRSASSRWTDRVEVLRTALLARRDSPQVRIDLGPNAAPIASPRTAASHLQYAPRADEVLLP